MTKRKYDETELALFQIPTDTIKIIFELLPLVQANVGGGGE